MQIGVVFPQTEIGADVAALRAYAETVEELGFDHLGAYDHVLGADPAFYVGWNGPYDVHTTFHEPMVLFGYVAAITNLELVTNVLVLPQRQTALVAKQAAQIDLLTAGRFRLGVGVGWNAVEYEALGMDFTNRGRRCEEQVELLLRLWSEQTVTLHGTYETVNAAGLSPLPVQRPIPVWFGGQSPATYRRIGRLGAGWFPQVRPGPNLDDALAQIETAANAAGRDASMIGMEGQVQWSGDLERLVGHVERWRRAGATHVSITTMNAELSTVDDHLAVLARVSDAFDLASVARHPQTPS